MKISDDTGRYKALLVLDENKISGSAEDFIFTLLGEADPKSLLSEKSLGEQYLTSFEGLRKLIFDRDEQGLFIREGIGFSSDEQEVEPEAPFRTLFKSKVGDGSTYFSANLLVRTPESLYEDSKTIQMKVFRLMILLHMVALGKKVDVIKVDPDLSETIEEAESKNLLAIDTKNAVYRLSPNGEKAHASLLEEARELIRRYDLYSDADIAPSGETFFLEGQGDDLRVPVWELCGINPFRARFVLGLNDGEWDDLPDWAEASNSPDFYDEIFKPIESAPTVEEVGREKVEKLVSAGRQFLRQQSEEPEDTDDREDRPADYSGYNDNFFDRSWWWLLLL